MKRFTGMLPFLLVMAVLYYAFPFALLQLGMAVLPKIGIMIIVSFLCSLIYSVFRPFGSFLFALLSGLIFLPSAFLYYEGAWIYTFVFAITCLIGGVFGTQIIKLRKIKEK
ncbi:hypothetical protein [Clostridium merdae]|uniref:hypothetical protein n=1 Tax=Clostridium merdae TaxID=1958780 RepID=UPI001FA85831|nr:hypothetical protein [Clostridium merdae]